MLLLQFMIEKLPDLLTSSMTFYDVAVSDNLFSKTEMRQFGASRTDRLREVSKIYTSYCYRKFSSIAKKKWEFWRLKNSKNCGAPNEYRPKILKQEHGSEKPEFSFVFPEPGTKNNSVRNSIFLPGETGPLPIPGSSNYQKC